MFLSGKGKAAHLKIGRNGEKAAKRLFLNMGCTFLAKDVRMPGGEMDLVFRDGKTLVFIEVKSRRIKKKEDAAFVHPSDALHPKQKRRIYRASHQYMREIGNPALPYRYDLVEVLFLAGKGLYMMKHHKSAFGSRNFSSFSTGGFSGFSGTKEEFPIYF